MWRIVLWDDDMNTGATMTFVLHRVVGLTLAQAVDLTHQVGREGFAQVPVIADQQETGVVAARMQVFGLRVEVAPA
ncbi:ATP-dependent Clp protease adaptor ClpS [Actinocrispum sp. NPDC049592]|uniref:ATP-dependent Clp protease adaptor ClpS n=1 Tax=Actinocrispum sp. NPDC049592 TaxID=3154835 RepID=UPI0034261637